MRHHRILALVPCCGAPVRAREASPAVFLGSIAGPGSVVHWNVSVCNPHLVALLRTNVKPSGRNPPTACASGVAARAAARLRWCAKGA